MSRADRGRAVDGGRGRRGRTGDTLGGGDGDDDTSTDTTRPVPARSVPRPASPQLIRRRSASSADLTSAAARSPPARARGGSEAPDVLDFDLPPPKTHHHVRSASSASVGLKASEHRGDGRRATFSEERSRAAAAAAASSPPMRERSPTRRPHHRRGASSSDSSDSGTEVVGSGPASDGGDSETYQQQVSTPTKQKAATTTKKKKTGRKSTKIADTMTRQDVANLRNNAKAPLPMKQVLIAMSMLMGTRPEPDESGTDDYWRPTQALLSRASFLTELRASCKGRVTANTAERVLQLLAELNPHVVETCSLTALTVLRWVEARLEDLGYEVAYNEEASASQTSRMQMRRSSTYTVLANTGGLPPNSREQKRVERENRVRERARRRLKRLRKAAEAEAAHRYAEAQAAARAAMAAGGDNPVAARSPTSTDGGRPPLIPSTGSGGADSRFFSFLGGGGGGDADSENGGHGGSGGGGGGGSGGSSPPMLPPRPVPALPPRSSANASSSSPSSPPPLASSASGAVPPPLPPRGVTKSVSASSLSSSAASPPPSSGTKTKLKLTRDSSLKDVMSMEGGYEQMLEHLEKEFASENILFYKEVEDFQEDSDVGHALAIYNTYIKDGSDLQINLSGALKKEIDAQSKFWVVADPDDEVDATIFDKARDEIAALMERDSLPRFKKRLEVAQ